MLRSVSMFAHPSTFPAGKFSSSPFQRCPSINQRRLFSSCIDKKYGYHHVLMKWPVSKGNTLLHESIKGCYLGKGKIDDTVVSKLIEKIGIEDVGVMSAIVNDDGRLPVCMMPPLYDSKSSFLRQQLHDLLQSHPIRVKNMGELLEIEEVNKRINLGQTNYHRQDLSALVNAINKTRINIRYSNSHPSYNDLDEIAKREISAVIQMMRNSYLNKRSTIMTSAMVSSVSNEVRRYSHGNCHEYSCVLAEYIMNSLPDLSVEIVNVRNGDHVFVVVGRDQESDILKPDSWGCNAIVCDAWSGDIYMADELSRRLTTFSIMFMNAEMRRVLKSYNPNFHCLYVSFSSRINELNNQLSRKM